MIPFQPAYQAIDLALTRNRRAKICILRLFIVIAVPSSNNLDTISLDTISSVKLLLAAINPTRSRSKSDNAAALAADYLARAARYIPCDAQTFPSESDLLASLDKQSARTAPVLILLDSRGKQLSSESFAEHIGRLRDSGTQSLILAIGPADGWSAVARTRASLILSFGPITLPHELARAVLAEQIYRALTILANHPYHSGH